MQRRPEDPTEDASIGRRASRPTVPLAAATRDYARAVANGTVDFLHDRDMAGLFDAMGPEIWAWQYARRLTGEPPWRAWPNLPEDGERQRAAQLMRADVVVWEKALEALRAAKENARRYRGPSPDPLNVPADILAVIDARLVAAVRRAVRRSARGGEGAGPAPDGAGPPKP